MAGNKTVPVTFNGTVVGSASVDENGLLIGEIEFDRSAAEMLHFNDINVMSIYLKENDG